MTNEEAMGILYSHSRIDPKIGCEQRFIAYHNGDVEKALDIAIKAIKQTTWIPVSERLPEEDVDVLVVVELPDGKNGTLQRIEIASFGLMYPLSSEKGWITNNFTRLDMTEVIAWMPLPPSYQGEENG